MIKIILCVCSMLFLCVPSLSFADDSVLLRWKIPFESALGFKTVMNVIGPKDKVDINLDKLASGVGIPTDAKKTFDDIEIPTSFQYTTTIQQLDNKNLNIKMIKGEFIFKAPPQTDSGREMQEMLKMTDGIVLIRCEVDSSGDIQSFYYKQSQKNLISIMFGLPKEKVEVGDSWTLPVSFMELDAGFIPSTATKLNRVTLTKLTRTEDNDTIATLEYTLSEYFKGRVKNPISKEEAPSEMSYSFVGIGEFIINKGTWNKLIGQIILDSTGFREVQSTQLIRLDPLDKVPQDLLALE